MTASGRDLPPAGSRRASGEAQEADLQPSGAVSDALAGATVRAAFQDMKYTECTIPPANGGGFRLDAEEANWTKSYPVRSASACAWHARSKA